MQIETFPKSTQKFQNFSEFEKNSEGCRHLNKHFILSQNQLICYSILLKIYSFSLMELTVKAKQKEEIRIL